MVNLDLIICPQEVWPKTRPGLSIMGQIQTLTPRNRPNPGSEMGQIQSHIPRIWPNPCMPPDIAQDQAGTPRAKCRPCPFKMALKSGKDSQKWTKSWLGPYNFVEIRPNWPTQGLQIGQNQARTPKNEPNSGLDPLKWP